MNFRLLLASAVLITCFGSLVFVEGRSSYIMCSEQLGDETVIRTNDCVDSEELRKIAISITADHEYSDKEIVEMKQKAVILRMHDGALTIELFPEDAPNTVNNFLKLVEHGYYDGIVFHRIIPNFVIQGGDPNTKDPTIDRQKWGTGGPGYNVKEEFNTLQHDRGMVSMARGQHVDSAGSQFFIVHYDAPQLDGKYTVFGRLVPLGNSYNQLDLIADLPKTDGDKPLDVTQATILKAEIIDDWSTPTVVSDPQRNKSVLKTIKPETGGTIDSYYNGIHKIGFEVPYRWDVIENEGDGLSLTLQPGELEHNVKPQIEASGITPQVMITSSSRDQTMAEQEVNIDFLTIKGAGEPEIIHNYIFENADGRKAHIIMTSQKLETPIESVLFKSIQIRFTNSETDYAIVYMHASDFFRYEVNSFHHVVKTFEFMLDGKMQNIGFDSHPVYKQVFADARMEAEDVSEPPARIGGCLIATAVYGSELAPQVQLLREIRDNTVLQTEIGIGFIDGFNQFYYSFSPTIADYERENPVFKEAVKLTLTPLLASLTLLQYTDIDSEHEMLGYGIGVILLNIGMYFVAPAILITKIRSFYKLQ